MSQTAHGARRANASLPRRRVVVYPIYPSGQAEPRLRVEEPRLPGEVLGFGTAVQRSPKKVPDCFRATHGRLSGSPGPVMTLRAGRGPARPPGNAETSTLQSPSGGGSGEQNAACSIGGPESGRLGNGMLPVFLQHLSPKCQGWNSDLAKSESVALKPEA